MHASGLRGRHGVEERVERVIVDRDQLRGVFCDVAVAGDHDRERLADVAGGSHCSCVERDGRVDSGREGARHCHHVVAGEDSYDAGQHERRRGIDRHTRMREL